MDIEQSIDWCKRTRAEAELHFGIEQAHLARFWNDLNGEQRISLIRQFDSINIQYALESFQKSAQPKARDNDGKCQTVSGTQYRDMKCLQAIDDDHYAVRKHFNEQQLHEFWHKGLEAIAECKVGVIVLAGGQATRLGAVYPKGTLSLELSGYNSSDSLLAIQAARIARLQALAAAKFRGSKPLIQWLVMTSKATEKDTVEHLMKILPEFGLEKDQLTIFSQNDFPCFDANGRLMLSTKWEIATAPDGNGGLYTAIRPYLSAMRERGVQYLHVYCVDNVLCRVADPHFIGFCALKHADCAAKVVEKVEPNEAVGVVCRESGKIKVVEYSEISKEMAEKRDESGRLLLRAGNIANHFFTIDFLDNVCQDGKRLDFHRAHKKIPFIDDNGQTVKPDQPNGFKLEQFVFDVFEYSNDFYVWEVSREEEFSPLKNAESAHKDCMSTARRDLSNECRRWLHNAGARIDGQENIFIHPLRSYVGEDLEEFSNTHLSTPVVLNYR
ncbi:unnamed protein product [Anisakis simplex]|uniref:UDP-N-acetylglucosamine diphosphorylase n=1 Tax=Anisakis simplex TaxID=6269 RepID=A0A0M3JR97_ANISI|nr:unnamed protein product [Anisakis simplex]